MCIARSFATLTPTHHVVITPIGCRAEATFSKDIGKAMTHLRAKFSAELQYARVYEWSRRRIHAHLLLRVPRQIPRGLIKRALDKVRPDGYRVSCEQVRSVGAMARYFVKHLTDRGKKAELTPEGFRGRVFQASSQFLTKPLVTFWRDIQTEWREEKALQGRLTVVVESVGPNRPETAKRLGGVS